MKYPACLMLLPALLSDAAPAEPEATSPGKERFDPVIELPDGTGKQELLMACTRCHTLEGLDAYKGFWVRRQWLEMVEGMVKNGAVMNREQVEKVTDYLTTNFGPATNDQ